MVTIELFDYGDAVVIEVPSPDEVTPLADGARLVRSGSADASAASRSSQGPTARSTVAVAEAGVGGRPLLLVHGFTGAKEDFTDWLDPLAELGWHAVAPDQRGHGESSQPADEAAYSFDALRGRPARPCSTPSAVATAASCSATRWAAWSCRRPWSTRPSASRPSC